MPEKKWSETLTYLAQKEIQRRTKMSVVHAGSVAISTPAAGAEGRKMGRTPVPVTVKKAMLQKQSCCQFKDKTTGKICGSTRFLQVDHRHSVWAGGGNEIENLQMLCAQHNLHKYRQESFFTKRFNPVLD